MKSIALLAATTMMSCSLALAQAQKPAAAETAKPAAAEAAKPAAAETAKPAAAQAPKPAAARAAAKPVMTGVRKARRDEDARHCLGRSSNTEIIKCAEAYL
jgi:hypothetical protein